MTKVVAVIPSRRLRNTVTGATASIFGAAPWYSDEEKVNWTIETVGFTWKKDDGTVGLCRKPAETLDEALEVMRKFNAKFA